jgi:hypothetical protein
MNIQNKHRYYNFIIRRNYKTHDKEYTKGDKFQAIVSPFVSDGIELFSFITKDADRTFVIPCEYVKFSED